MAMKGIDIIILANTGSDATPVWTPIGGQRGATLSESVETFETTHKASGGYKEYEAGFADWTISCDGVYIETNTGYLALVTAMRAKTKVKVRWQEATDDVFEGLAFVTSRDLDAPHDGEATYSIELQGSGAPTLNPA